MTQQEFTKAMTYLGLAYNKEFTSEQVGVWFTFFNDSHYDDFIKAVKRLISKSKFIPSIAEIKQEIATITVPALQLTADEEWENVQTAIKRFGQYRADEAIKTLHPVTVKVVNRLGGFSSICRSEDGDWTRKNFMQLFDAYMMREKEISTLSEPQLTLAEITRKAELKALEKPLLEVDIE